MMTGEGFEERQADGLLENTASHMPLISHQSRLGESVGLHDDTDLRQIMGSQPGVRTNRDRELYPQLQHQCMQRHLRYMPTQHS